MSSTPKFYDRVQETSTTTGTGTYTLAGAVTGFQSFAVIADGNSCYYCAQEVDGSGNPSGGYEVGLGTYTASGTTLSRDTILASSNGGSAVSWAAGTRRIFLTVPAHEAPSLDASITTSLRGTKHIVAVGSNLPTGDNDIYTVPTGKRALIFGPLVYNSSAGSITWYTAVKVAGTYYRIDSSATTTAGNGGSSVATQLLEAGDILAVNCATTLGLNVSFSVIEFDATAALTQGRVLGLSTGDNTIYTCPSGKTAGTALPRTGSFNSGQGAAFFVADGSTRNVYLHRVANGASPATGNRLSASFSVGANVRSSFLFAVGFEAGDFMNINVDVGNAAQYAAVWVLER